jgi:hypothetical protein
MNAEERDVLQIKLSQHHSLDVVRLQKQRRFRIVFAERFGVQRRSSVEITFENALQLAKFFVVIDNGMDSDGPITTPGRPSLLPSAEMVEMLKEYFDDKRAPTATDDYDDPRTGTTRIVMPDDPR